MNEAQFLKSLIVIGLIVAGLEIATARAQKTPAVPGAINTPCMVNRGSTMENDQRCHRSFGVWIGESHVGHAANDADIRPRC